MKKTIQEEVRDLDTDMALALTGYLKYQNIAQENFCGELILWQVHLVDELQLLTPLTDSESNMTLDSLTDVFMEVYSRMPLLII